MKINVLPDLLIFNLFFIDISSMKHYKYNSLTAHLMVDCFPLIHSEFRLTVSSFLSYFSKRVSNFFISYCFSLFVCLLLFHLVISKIAGT